MPRINRPRSTRTPRAASSGAATSTSGATATTPAAGTSGTTPPVPSAAGEIQSNVPKATIDGFGGKRPTMPTNATRRFAGDSQFQHYHADGEGPVDRGFIEVNADPIPGGCRVTVDTFHKTKNDAITLFLMCEVLDTKTNQLRTVTLGILAENEKINGDSYRGQKVYDLKYDDVNKWLKARNPALKLNPGHTPLSVAARFKSGHQAGGPGRGGSFRTPFPAGAQSATATRIGNLSGNRGEATDLPLDMQVAYDPALTRTYKMLKPGGAIVSRLESEFKGTTDKAEMTRAVKEMYAMVEKIQGGDKSDVEALLGKDWTISTVNRYWLKDEGGAEQPGKPGTGFFKGFRVDDEGLPIQDPMRDSYMDDGNLSMTHHEGAIRLRKNKQATFINVKPGGGRLDDKTGIRQRVEVGVELKADADVDDAAGFLRGVSTNSQWGNTVYNHAQREVHKFDPTIALSESLKPFLEVVQDRHKFTVKNEKTGVEIEFSFDFVKATTTRPEHAGADGKPQVIEFCVLEGELDHLQLQSANQNEFQAAGASSSSFSDDRGQDDWLKKTSSKVTLDVDPRLHEVEDLKNNSFRSTESYKAFEGANGKLLQRIFPRGLKPGKQKAAHAATLLDLIITDKNSALTAAKRQFRSLGLEWTANVDKAFKKRLDKDDGIKDVGRDLGRLPQFRNVKQYLAAVLDTQRTPALTYDKAGIEKTITATLDAAGYTINDGVKDLIKKLDPKKLDPVELKQTLDALATATPAYMFRNMAARLGQRGRAPEPTFSPAKFMKSIEPQLDTAWVATADRKAIEKFLGQMLQQGVTGDRIASYMRNFSSYGDRALGYIARSAPGGSAAQVPVIHADKKRVVDEANVHFTRHNIKLTPALKKLLEQVAEQKPLTEVQTFVSSLSRSDFERFLQKQAKDLGVTMPALELDKAALDESLKAACAGANVVYDASLKGFCHALADAGTPSSKIAPFVSRLWMNTPEQALKASHIKVPAGLSVPDIAFAPTAFDHAAEAAFDENFVGNGAKLLAFGEKLIKDGANAPGDVVAMFEKIRVPDLAAAIKSAKVDVPGGLTVPAVDFDEDAFVAHLKQAHGAKVSPAVEAWVKKVFDKASGDAKFSILRMKKGSLSSVAKRLAEQSGVALPDALGL